MDISPRQLRAFLAVAEAGGFTAAARRLGWVQSTISTLVADLEAATGVRLFERSSRRVALSAAGEAFRPRAAALLADLAAAIEAARAPGEEAPLVVATPPLLAAALLPPAIATLRAALPALRVVVREAGATQALGLVTRGEAGLALGTFPPEATPAGGATLRRIRLGTDALALFCPAGHPFAAERRALPWRRLAGAAEVALTHDSAVRGLVDAARTAAGVPPAPPAFEVAQMTTAIALVAAGLGVAALPMAAAPLAQRGRVAIRPLSEPVVTREIALLRRPGLHGLAAAGATALQAALVPLLRGTRR
ncbi:LysR family transcriptional regulator [Roseomonas sp. NAR14]|uniref:LysR family transcriptional regulator n=1 Tax=Roseomonas acroporae TaxID=2937791 RepID=A0A9X1YDK4_9PROT|nr:LysR family transcriptional regulator [Roseomonas acroporae]MCK8787055.1 LysR family transcriptional regulator [Roseomonas acroporae]